MAMPNPQRCHWKSYLIKYELYINVYDFENWLFLIVVSTSGKHKEILNTFKPWKTNITYPVFNSEWWRIWMVEEKFWSEKYENPSSTSLYICKLHGNFITIFSSHILCVLCSIWFIILKYFCFYLQVLNI